MKELSIRDKARRYDEAIKVAKSNYETIMQIDNDCTFAKEGIVNTFHHMFPELKESEEDKDEKIRKEIISFLITISSLKDGKTVSNEDFDTKTIFEWVDWLKKQSKKVEPIEGFNSEFERQISQFIASIVNKEYEYTEAFVKWTSDALLNYAKREIENRNGQKSKKVSLWKHWKNGIAGNGEGKLIYLVKEGNTYSLSSCLGFECDYIELSELDSLMFGKPCEQKPAISDEAIREGVVHFGITQYQIDNWLKKYVDVEEQGRVKESQISRHENETCEENDDSLTSEDEKIRKTLIHIVKGACDKYGIKYQGKEIGEEKLLSWLEKQGDKDRLIKELGEYKVKCTQGVLEQHLNGVNKDNERLIKTTIAFLKEFADKGYENAAECIDWLEKQGEQKQDECAQINLNPSEYIHDMGGNGCYLKNTAQKPVEWFEPKFHDGDWVTDDNGETVFHITIDKNMYQLETVGGTSCHFSYECIEEKFRLWTIQDAKDGDVLRYTDTFNRDWIFVYKYKPFDSYTIDHYSLIIGRDFFPGGSLDIDIECVEPATKEQRDLLFKKMKEAGYRWDEEKRVEED